MIMPPTVEENVVIDLVLFYLNKVKAKDEYYTVDPQNRQSGIWHQIWYSHIYGGGCYNHAFGFFIKDAQVEIAPAAQYGTGDNKGRFAWPKTGKFNLLDPKGTEIKKFIRQCLDEVKKYQNRSSKEIFK